MNRQVSTILRIIRTEAGNLHLTSETGIRFITDRL